MKVFDSPVMIMKRSLRVVIVVIRMVDSYLWTMMQINNDLQ